MAQVLVEFVDDVYPHCAGDIVLITTEEKQQFDKTIEARNINGYKLIETTPEAEAKTPVEEAKPKTKTGGKK